MRDSKCLAGFQGYIKDDNAGGTTTICAEEGKVAER
jgi:hypothetical protein